MCIVSELFTFNTGETGALWETPQDRAWPWPDKFLISCEGGIGTARTLYGKVEKNHEQRFEWIWEQCSRFISHGCMEQYWDLTWDWKKWWLRYDNLPEMARNDPNISQFLAKGSQVFNKDDGGLGELTRMMNRTKGNRNCFFLQRWDMTDMTSMNDRWFQYCSTIICLNGKHSWAFPGHGLWTFRIKRRIPGEQTTIISRWFCSVWRWTPNKWCANQSVQLQFKNSSTNHHSSIRSLSSRLQTHDGQNPIQRRILLVPPADLSN